MKGAGILLGTGQVESGKYHLLPPIPAPDDGSARKGPDQRLSAEAALEQGLDTHERLSAFDHVPGPCWVLAMQRGWRSPRVRGRGLRGG